MSGGGTAPTAFTPPNQAGAASSLQSAATNLSSLGATTTGTAVPGYQNLYNAAQTNPYAAGAQAAANATAATGTQFGNQEVSTGQGLMNLSQSLGQYAPGIAEAAFDPQNAIYNQMYGQNMDQTNAINAQSGVAGSPFGAGLSAQSGQNFNLNWEAQRQARENAGVAALGQLGTAEGNIATAGGNVGTAGLNALTTSGNLPTDTYQAQQKYIAEALNSLVAGDTAAGQPFTQAAQADTSYLGIGQQAAQTNLQAFQAQQAADASFWGGIGKLVGGVGSIAFMGL